MLLPQSSLMMKCHKNMFLSERIGLPFTENYQFFSFSHPLLYYLLRKTEDCSVAKLQKKSPVQFSVSCSQFIHHAVVYGLFSPKLPQTSFYSHQLCVDKLKRIVKLRFLLKTYPMHVWISKQWNREIQIKIQKRHFKVMNCYTLTSSLTSLADSKLKAKSQNSR